MSRCCRRFILIRFLSDRPSLKETLCFLLNEEEGYADKRTDLMERDDTSTVLLLLFSPTAHCERFKV